jgi:hypothetical protein
MGFYPFEGLFNEVHFWVSMPESEHYIIRRDEMSKYIYTESIGDLAFYIVETNENAVQGELRFVWLDKYGIANIFARMEEMVRYLDGDILSCERECIYPYETGIEGVDFIDEYFGIGD